MTYQMKTHIIYYIIEYSHAYSFVYKVISFQLQSKNIVCDLTFLTLNKMDKILFVEKSKY